LSVPARAIVRGDATEPAISAASILAKTERDRIMLALHLEYPDYGFDGHKGYPTAKHVAALRAHGASPVHRRSFGPVRDVLIVRGS
jgi:ribonuclease HII